MTVKAKATEKFRGDVDKLCNAVVDGRMTLKEAARAKPAHVALLAIMRCRGMTQESLGSLVGMTQPTISSWLHGHTLPEAPQRKILERALGIPAQNWSRE